MEHKINPEELPKQADDNIEIIRKKAKENSVTIGMVVDGFGYGMEAYIKTMQSLYLRLPNDDEIRAILSMANGVLQFIGVKEVFNLDTNDLIKASITMWRQALAKCGFDTENMEGAI